MNDSLKNTQTILTQINDESNEGRTLQEEVDSQANSVLEPKRQSSDANLGNQYLSTLDQNINALPIMSLSETVKNEIGKEVEKSNGDRLPIAEIKKKESNDETTDVKKEEAVLYMPAKKGEESALEDEGSDDAKVTNGETTK